MEKAGELSAIKIIRLMLIWTCAKSKRGYWVWHIIWLELCSPLKFISPSPVWHNPTATCDHNNCAR